MNFIYFIRSINRVGKGGELVAYCGNPRKISQEVIDLVESDKVKLVESGTLFDLSSFTKSVQANFEKVQLFKNPLYIPKKLKMSVTSFRSLFFSVYPDSMEATSKQNEARQKAACNACNAIGFAVQVVSEMLQEYVSNNLLVNMDKKTFFLGNKEYVKKNFRGTAADRKHFQKMRKSVKVLTSSAGGTRRTVGLDVISNFSNKHLKALVSFKDESRRGHPITRLEVHSNNTIYIIKYIVISTYIYIYIIL